MSSGMLPTNAIVARITGMKKSLLSDNNDAGRTMNEESEEIMSGNGSVMSSPNPLDDIRPQRQRTRRVSEDKPKLQVRGDNADYQYDLPKSVDSQDEKVPGHKMPDDEDPDDMYGVDKQDTKPQSIGRTESKKHMGKFFKECIGSMDQFNFYSGLPLTEEAREAKSGEVPTAGVNKTNKMKSGLPGLEGQSLQDIDPEEGPGGKDEVGDDTYTTLDQAIAMLKKEGVDTEALWGEFLGTRGLTVELFSQLMDEADDAEEIDQLLAVEDIFLKAIPKLLPDLLPEGMQSLAKLAKKPLKESKESRTGAVAPRAAAARGGKSLAESLRKSIQEKPAGLPMKKKSRTWNLECDHDHITNGPKMPWHESKLSDLANKYLSEDKWIGKMHIKKGALHKKLGVPAGKNIPKNLKKKTEKSNGQLGREARLAATLGKFKR